MTPEEEKKLQDWYTLEFRDLVEQSRTLGQGSLQEGRPEDWKRLQIWDGQNLVQPCRTDSTDHPRWSSRRTSRKPRRRENCSCTLWALNSPAGTILTRRNESCSLIWMSCGEMK